MSKAGSSDKAKTPSGAREDRLKAALRDNLQKRKAQARKRGVTKNAPKAQTNED